MAVAGTDCRGSDACFTGAGSDPVDPDATDPDATTELEDETRDVVQNPMVIVEVLSDSTETYDREEKFSHYRRIPSLREYLLVSQHERRIE